MPKGFGKVEFQKLIKRHARRLISIKITPRHPILSEDGESVWLLEFFFFPPILGLGSEDKLASSFFIFISNLDWLGS